MRRPPYVLGERHWSVDLAQSFVEGLLCGVVFLVVMFLVGCGDNCPPDDVPPVCLPGAAATIDLCGYSTTIEGTDYPVAGCTGFAANDRCTVPAFLGKPDAHGRVLVDALCVSHCQVQP